MAKNDGTKDRLLVSAEKLMRECETMDDVTSRAIASDSGVNQALINYHFGSKDGLLKAAMDRMFEDTATDLMTVRTGTGDPRGALRSFLIQMSGMIVRYEKYMRQFIPGLVTDGGLETPEYLVPLFKEHYGDSKTVQECRLMSYEMVTFLQVLLYRADDIKDFAGVDARSESDRARIIEWQIDLFFGRAAR
jgi:TetR/AcrR family transcriptional regulator, regulator of cefoperazone and chloramphenicol sensitivity